MVIWMRYANCGRPASMRLRAIRFYAEDLNRHWA